MKSHSSGSRAFVLLAAFISGISPSGCPHRASLAQFIRRMRKWGVSNLSCLAVRQIAAAVDTNRRRKDRAQIKEVMALGQN